VSSALDISNDLSSTPAEIEANTVYMTAPFNNGPHQDMQVIDFGVSYQRDFGPCYGSAVLGIQGTYYLDFTYYPLTTPPLPGASDSYEVAGFVTSPTVIGSLPQYRLTPSFQYVRGGFSFSALGNYIPNMTDISNFNMTVFDPTQTYSPDPNNPNSANGNQAFVDRAPEIRDYFKIDLLFTYQFGLSAPQAPAHKESKSSPNKNAIAQVVGPHWYTGTTLGFGINNVNNSKPPRYNDGVFADHTDATLFDPYQRYFYVTAQKTF
jgi:hypothetical protein